MAGRLSRSDMEVLDSFVSHDGRFKRFDPVWTGLKKNYDDPVKSLLNHKFLVYDGIYVRISERGSDVYDQMRKNGKYE